MLTFRTLIELLEYVLRNGTFPGRSAIPLLALALEEGWAPFRVRVGRDVSPLEEPEDRVSSESVPFSNELDITLGSGGTGAAGASNPFLVVDEDKREFNENKPFALGADATRRMKRDAEAPIDLGDLGDDGPTG